MAQGQIFAAVLLLGLLLIAVVSDVRHHRIPNLLILIGLILALAVQAYTEGRAGLGNGALGLLVGFSLFIPLYALGGVAAGDVKLMAMVGSYLTFYTSIWAVALSLISGCLLGIFFLIYKRQFWRSLHRYWVMLSLCTYVPAVEGDAIRMRFPYALAILTGTTFSLVWRPAGLPAGILG